MAGADVRRADARSRSLSPLNAPGTIYFIWELEDVAALAFPASTLHVVLI